MTQCLASSGLNCSSDILINITLDNGTNLLDYFDAKTSKFYFTCNINNIWKKVGFYWSEIIFINTKSEYIHVHSSVFNRRLFDE